MNHVALGFAKQAFDSQAYEVRSGRLFSRHDSNKPGRIPSRVKVKAETVPGSGGKMHYSGEEEIKGPERSRVKKKQVALHGSLADKNRRPLGLHHVLPDKKSRRFRMHRREQKRMQGVRD